MKKPWKGCWVAALLAMLASAIFVPGPLSAVDGLTSRPPSLVAPTPVPEHPASTAPQAAGDFSDADFQRADQPQLGHLKGGEVDDGIDLWMFFLRLILIGFIIALFDDGHHHAHPYHSYRCHRR